MSWVKDGTGRRWLNLRQASEVRVSDVGTNDWRVVLFLTQDDYVFLTPAHSTQADAEEHATSLLVSSG